jgi:AraC family transcriptional regulator
MLTYALGVNGVRIADFEEPASSSFNDPRPWDATNLRRIARGSANDDLSSNVLGRQLLHCGTSETDVHALEITPAHVVGRRAVAWDGITVEIIRSVTHDKVEIRFRAPRHLLLVHEEGVRHDGETLVGDLPPSRLRTLRRKLTFVPAGHEYRDWQQPRVPCRITCFYFDPTKMPIPPNANRAAPLVPRLLFENDVLWDAAVKLAAAIGQGCENERYCEALGVIVAHELLRIQGLAARREPLARGGLAVWQQRIVARYIEEHLAERISLAALAKLVRLSSYYFCRAFKQSFGVPPHRYHINRRIERAKALLANPEESVTEIGLALGFSETSSFSAAFRHTTGITPTQYRRALG